ncbi:hypothetical protein BDQ17DRAFT_1543830 [Cyathus striatus]|nr:hypothetical protein BDQ17DRAFT_1543830 [Cyathus striatus]
MAPELVLTWAVRQLRGARDIFNMYKSPERNWTMRHAQFLQMGGFHLHSGECKGVVSRDIFDTLLREGKITFPNITEAEIQDKSKADGLSKIILIIQTLWFVIQCVGRYAQGLALTQLEVATLAVISSTFMLCIIWWHKPLDVRHPIYLDSVMTSQVIIDEQDLQRIGSVPRILAAEQTITGDINEVESSDTGNCLVAFCHFIQCALQWTMHPLKIFYGTLQSIGRTVCEASAASLHKYGCLGTIFFVFIGWPILKPLDEMTNIRTKTVYTERVSTYFAADKPDPDWLENFVIKQNSISSLGGAVLGLVHCISWGSQFPTTVERNLWQISSLALVASAAFICLWYVIGYTIHIMTSTKPIWESFILGVTLIPVTITIGIYVLVRYYLIFEAFFTLRSLPPSALETVQWSNFIPHI